jgi:hypothetical protein
MLIPVKGHSDLYRDSESNAIINKNKSGASLAREAKLRALNEKERIDKLENDVSEIKNMLKQLLER